jgi:hypothetical protein
MAERKPLSKKIRFEVFKRDSFTCQYCGTKAPDVILEVDHIKPVKEGGNSDLMNLITSCFNCNRGKGKREIKDNSIIEKQRKQIEELNLKRQQLEMMLEWRNGLSDINAMMYNNAIVHFNSFYESDSLTENGEKELSKLVRKYGLNDTLNVIDEIFEKYPDKEATYCFNKIGAYLNYRTLPDHLKKIAYIKGIVRNKFKYINEKLLISYMTKYYEDGYDLDNLRERLVNNEIISWSQFCNFMEQ